MVIPGAIRAVSSHHFISRPHASPRSWPRRQWWSCSWLHWLLPILPPYNFTGNPVSTFFSGSYLGGIFHYSMLDWGDFDSLCLTWRYQIAVLFKMFMKIGRATLHGGQFVLAAESPLGINFLAADQNTISISPLGHSELWSRCWLQERGGATSNHAVLWLHFNVRHTTCKTVSTELKHKTMQTA